MVVLVLIWFDFVFPISRFGRREVICLLGVFVFCLCFCNEVKKNGTIGRQKYQKKTSACRCRMKMKRAGQLQICEMSG